MSGERACTPRSPQPARRSPPTMYIQAMRRRLPDAIFLTLTVMGGAWLRLCGLGKPSLWLDEIYIVDLLSKARHYPLWRWLVGFQPENGPLYFAGELAGTFLPTPELAARMAPALCGIAAI